MHLLDTNIVAARLNGDPRVALRLGGLEPERVVLCAPVVAELVFGAEASARRIENLERIARLASAVRVLAFDELAASRFGRMKASLKRRGVAKTDFDLAIAAIAVANDAVLVTHDGSLLDGSIEQLRTEDWLADE
jgi:tRNA(fMet)-specific endonuclease VapC